MCIPIEMLMLSISFRFSCMVVWMLKVASKVSASFYSLSLSSWTRPVRLKRGWLLFDLFRVPRRSFHKAFWFSSFVQMLYIWGGQTSTKLNGYQLIWNDIFVFMAYIVENEDSQR